MNSSDEKSVISVDADTVNGGRRGEGNNAASGLNSKRSKSIKIDSIRINLGIINEKECLQKCRHFSIRGYVAKMREKGRSNLLPFTEQLPPIDVPNFKQWLCQRCVWNCEAENASHETALTSAKSNSQKDRNGVTIRPFGEGPSGVKSVGNGNGDKNMLAALGVNNNQSLQEIIPDKAAVFQDQPIEATPRASGENRINGSREHENLEKAIAITTAVDPNGCSNEPPRRKARKVRLLKELLSGNTGNTENPPQKNENSALRLGPRSSSPPEASPQIKRKTPHDQRPVDITAPGYFGKKTKSSKVNAVPKTNVVVEHRSDPEARESGDNTNKYQCHKHGTQRSSVLDHNIGTDRMIAWRSIFNDMERLDDQITAANGVSGPTYDISGTEPDTAPPPPDKTVDRAKKTSSLPHKSKLFEEGSRKINVSGCRAVDDGQSSETELELGLSLNHDPRPQVRPRPLIPDQTPGQDRSRKPGFFLGESSVAGGNSFDLKSKERCIHDVGNRCVHGTGILQGQRPYTQLPYGGCSGHRKSEFSDPYKRNTGVRLYSDETRPHNHERQANMFPNGRSDEREIVELMAKNQYERSLYYPPIRSNNNRITPDPLGFPNVITNTPSFHPKYLSMIRPSSSIATSAGPAVRRNPAAGFFPRDRVSNFPMFDAFPQYQRQPSSGVWISDSGGRRHRDHDKKTPETRVYPTTDVNVPEAFGPYRNEPTVPFGQERVNQSNNDKGKNIIDLDLNIVAPNVIEVQSDSDSEPFDFTSQEYRNEAIPAMQLLSLMDAGKAPAYPFTDPKKLTNRSLTMAGKPNPVANYHCPCSTHFQLARDGSSLRNEDQNGRVSLSAHRATVPRFDPRNEYQNERVSLSSHRAIVPRFDPPETTVCTLNRNPADFSIPGPENQYMINYEDLKFRWEGCYKRKSAFPNGPKRQKRA